MNGFRVQVVIRKTDVRFFFWHCGVEQRKTALRRVEMELDEADEMVRTSPNIRVFTRSSHRPFP